MATRESSHNQTTDAVVSPDAREQELARAFEDNPTDPQRLTDLMEFLSHAGKNRQAADRLLRIAEGPDYLNHPVAFRDAVTRLGEATLGKCIHEARGGGRHAEARELANRLEWWPECVRMVRSHSNSSHDREARYYRERGDNALQKWAIRDALTAYAKALKRDPKNPSTLNNLGVAQSHRNRKAALGFFKGAHRLEPDNPAIGNNLAIALTENGRLCWAMHLIRESKVVLSYRIACIAARRFAENPMARYLKSARADAQALERLMVLLGREPGKWDRVLDVFIGYTYPIWLEKSLCRAIATNGVAPWITIDGMERLQALRESGQGAVFVSGHFFPAWVIPLVLSSMGFRVNVLAGENRLRNHGIPDTDSIRIWDSYHKKEFALRQDYLVRKALRRGEIYLLAGDGGGGGSRVFRTFLGRPREFRTGFAEMAVSAGVPAFPIFSALDLSGRITIEVFDPIEPGSDRIPHKERVADMIQQYADRLETYWNTYPESIGRGYLRTRLGRLVPDASENTEDNLGDAPRFRHRFGLVLSRLSDSIIRVRICGFEFRKITNLLSPGFWTK